MTVITRSSIPDLDLEKPFFKSKKAIAFVFTEMLHFIIILLAIILKIDGAFASPVLIAALINMGFISAGYIGGKTWLDRHVRVAKILASGKNGDSNVSTISTSEPQ